MPRPCRVFLPKSGNFAVPPMYLKTHRQSRARALVTAGEVLYTLQLNKLLFQLLCPWHTRLHIEGNGDESVMRNGLKKSKSIRAALTLLLCLGALIMQSARADDGDGCEQFGKPDSSEYKFCKAKINETDDEFYLDVVKIIGVGTAVAGSVGAYFGVKAFNAAVAVKALKAADTAKKAARAALTAVEDLGGDIEALPFFFMPKEMLKNLPGEAAGPEASLTQAKTLPSELPSTPIDPKTVRSSAAI